MLFLTSDNVLLEEVQIIAYGTQKKLTVTGSVSSIDTKDLLKSPTSSIGNMLAGSVSGISTVQYNGQPGLKTRKYLSEVLLLWMAPAHNH